MRALGKSCKWAGFFAGALLICTSASTHHGSASYKADKVVVLNHATVTQFVWANPHAMVLFDVKDDQGKVEHWAGEAGSPAAIRSMGWSKNSIRPGNIITVQLYPSKFESDVGRLVRIILADGTTLENSPRTDQGDASRY